MIEELSPPKANCLGEPQQPALLADESAMAHGRTGTGLVSLRSRLALARGDPDNRPDEQVGAGVGAPE